MDKKRLERLRAGSYRDFEILYKQYASNLYGFVWGLTRSTEQANEIVQDTFIKVWVNRANIDPEQPFRSYLFKIARNRMIDGFRKRADEPLFENYMNYCEEPTFGTPAEAEQQSDFDDFMSALKQAKQQLTPRQREVFELSKEEGLPSGEVAARLGISEQTVYNILSTALRLLKQKLKGNSFLFTLFFG